MLCTLPIFTIYIRVYRCKTQSVVQLCNPVSSSFALAQGAADLYIERLKMRYDNVCLDVCNTIRS